MTNNGSLRDLNYSFFLLHFKDTTFSIAGPFSKVQLDFTTIKYNYDEAAYKFPVWQVFRQPTEQDFQKFKSIAFVDYDVLGDKDNSREAAVLQHTLRNFLSLIASSVRLSKVDEGKYPPSLFDENITSELLGMGESLTWHGYPDARLRTPYCEVDILCHSSDTEDETSVYDFPCSQGNTTCVEVKPSLILKVHSSQLISTAIGSSFIEHNIHSDLNPAIPTVLINQFTYCICIYDSVLDILLISDVITFKRGRTIDKDGAYLLWLVCHHREFLHQLTPSGNSQYRSGFFDLASRHDWLEKYKNLKSKNSSWTSMPLVGFTLEEGPFVDGLLGVSEKPAKKRKIYEN